MATYSSLGADGELGEDHEERVGEGVSTHALSTMIGSKAGRVKACLPAGRAGTVWPAADHLDDFTKFTPLRVETCVRLGLEYAC